jgi:ABC-type lipoprotein release transport system permease subunit
VIRRRFEVGVRVAIGATPGRVPVLLVREIVVIAAIACLVGGSVSVGALTFVERMAMEPRGNVLRCAVQVAI